MDACAACKHAYIWRFYLPSLSPAECDSSIRMISVRSPLRIHGLQKSRWNSFRRQVSLYLYSSADCVAQLVCAVQPSQMGAWHFIKLWQRGESHQRWCYSSTGMLKWFNAGWQIPPALNKHTTCALCGELNLLLQVQEKAYALLSVQMHTFSRRAHYHKIAYWPQHSVSRQL